MSVEARDGHQPSNAYQIFILVLTVFSLLILVALVLPLNQATTQLLVVYDNLICVVFLIDFVLNLRWSTSKREYLIGRRGWLDLLGSIPAFGFFPYTALFRLARISRLARITRLLRGKNKKQLVGDVLRHRGQYAAFITILAALMVLAICSALVLQLESRSANANITTGEDALWWSVETISTVGYGDEYPVTAAGRITALFVMVAGVGIIGALASILASILVPPPGNDADQRGQLVAGTPQGPSVTAELEKVRLELAALRELITVERGKPPIR
jgi:voltage-gated potassium channel